MHFGNFFNCGFHSNVQKLSGWQCRHETWVFLPFPLTVRGEREFSFATIPGNTGPVPKNWAWNFHSRSRSQKLGMQFIIPIPVPKVWEWAEPFPFPFPNVQKSFPLTPAHSAPNLYQGVYISEPTTTQEFLFRRHPTSTQKCIFWHPTSTQKSNHLYLYLDLIFT